MSFQSSLFNVAPGILPPLDPGFRPLALGVRAFRAALAAAPGRESMQVALEQTPERIHRLHLEVFPAGAGREADNFRYLDWMVNFLLWSRGGWKVVLAGPGPLCQALARAYAAGGARAFDAELMGQAFGRTFQVETVAPAQVPAARSQPLALGGHLDGCRLGFDLGASDFKVAAVRDGAVVFSAELPWNPRVEPDPDYHFQRLNEGLRLAAAHLPRVDAIGGSSAGILVANQVRVASLFRAVPAARWPGEVAPFFARLQAQWQVPVEVINDGEVTALAGAMALGTTGILGLAMGSSEAAGYVDPDGAFPGWLNELAFAPVDANPGAGTDDWSQAPGIGAAYFSQQAVARLAALAGLGFPPALDLPARLEAVQQRLAAGDPAARAIFESIGVYLGYTLAWYAEFYALDHVLILGRVTSGPGGPLLRDRALAVLASQFPDLAAGIDLALPDERSRRVGQAVAAASLPALAGRPPRVDPTSALRSV